MAKIYGLMRLGRDAEVRTLQDGTPVCNLSLVYNYGKANENKERPSQWIDAALWGKRAEALAPYLTKGSQHLFTLSDVHMEKYADKDGYDAYKLAATVDDVELGPKREGAPAAGGSASSAGGQRRPASGGGSASAPAQAPKPQAGQVGEFDDDIPF